MNESASSFSLSEHIVPTGSTPVEENVFARRAIFLRQRAIANSLYEGALKVGPGQSEGVPLVDSVASFSLTIPGQKETYEFAFNEEGLAFARIESGSFYEIDMTRSQEDLKNASLMEQRSKSRLWKLLLRMNPGLLEDAQGLSEDVAKLTFEVKDLRLSLRALRKGLEGKRKNTDNAPKIGNPTETRGTKPRKLK